MVNGVVIFWFNHWSVGLRKLGISLIRNFNCWEYSLWPMTTIQYGLNSFHLGFRSSGSRKRFIMFRLLCKLRAIWAMECWMSIFGLTLEILTLVNVTLFACESGWLPWWSLNTLESSEIYGLPHGEQHLIPRQIYSNLFIERFNMFCFMEVIAPQEVSCSVLIFLGVWFPLHICQIDDGQPDFGTWEIWHGALDLSCQTFAPCLHLSGRMSGEQGRGRCRHCTSKQNTLPMGFRQETN